MYRAASLVSRTFSSHHRKTSSLPLSLLGSSTAGIVWWTHQSKSITTLEERKQESPKAPKLDEEKKESDSFFDAAAISKEALDDFWSKAVGSAPLEEGNQESPEDPNLDEEKKEADSFFDATAISKEALDDFWSKVIGSDPLEEGNQESPEDPNLDEEKKESDSLFDATANFKEDLDDIWSKVVGSDLLDDMGKESDDKKPEQAKKKGGGGTFFGDIAKNVMTLVAGSGKDVSIENLVNTLRENTEQGDVEDTTTFAEILAVLDQYKDSIGKVAEKFVGDLDFSKISPTSVFYYLELEDERKNPSWKRRVHRFCPGIDIDKVIELNDALDISLLSYADTVAEIREGLENNKTPYELVYAEVRSEPGKPANFIAVKRNQSSRSSELQVIMGVRGTKTVADAITDLLCDVEDYREGKAHSFILTSGKFLVEKHTKLLQDLLEKSGKKTLKLTLTGHSLGAGAASIAGIEFNDNKKFKVEVVGFGCPALLTKELAQKTDYITTVVNDSDMVPRMSGIALANLLIDVMEFDWFPYVQRDIGQALEELKVRQPFLFNDGLAGKANRLILPLLKDFAVKTVKKDKTEKLASELYPPGKCVHFYRDGSGISGNFVPNTFFAEIDVTRRMVDGTQ
jgi:hypothetical protein